MKCKAFLLSIIFGLVASPQVSASYVTVPNYFVSISNKTSVPADILYALAAKETNVKMNNGTVAPWPFTLNVNGKGYWYASYEDMMTAAYEFLNEGITSIDIGLFQVNWRWNGHRVQSIEELGEPKKMALWLRKFFLSITKNIETGLWPLVDITTRQIGMGELTNMPKSLVNF